MPVTIFYSWQSDTPRKINRAFIEKALKSAVEILGEEMEIQDALRDESLVVDSDTKNVAGTPPIAQTIFEKISKCTVFVPDFTFISRSPNGRLVPNPNVLIEYGWAVRDFGYDRMLPVMNTEFGNPKGNMPFDMQHLRNPVTYSLKDGASKQEIERTKDALVAELADAIKLIITKHGVRGEAAKKAPVFREQSPTWNRSVFWDMNRPLGVIDPAGLILHLDDGEKLFLRLIPTTPVLPITTFNEARILLTLTGRLFSMSNSHRSATIGRNEHGIFVCEYIPHQFDQKGAIVTNLSQLLMSRELWGVDAHCINSRRLKEAAKVDFGFFPCAAFEKVFVNTLSNYLEFARRTLEIPAPLKFIAGATNVNGYRMSLPVPMALGPEFAGTVVHDEIVYEGVIADYSIKPTEALRPFFNKVWDECGLARPNVEQIVQ